MRDKNQSLESFAMTGVLPMSVSKTGERSEPIDEVIICDSISGGAQYENNMPKRLSLIRRLADGTEYRADYFLAKELQTQLTEYQARVEELEKVRDQALGYVEMIERHLKPDEWNLRHAKHFMNRAIGWLKSRA